jgi:hypothetical protein
MNTGDGWRQGGRVEQISGHDLGGGAHALAKVLGPAGEAANGAALRLERAEQPAADVAGGAGEEDGGGVVSRFHEIRYMFV